MWKDFYQKERNLFILSVLSGASIFIAFLSALILYMNFLPYNKAYSEWQSEYVKPYLKSLEEEYSLIHVSFLDRVYRQENEIRKMFPQDDTVAVRFAIDKGGKAVSYEENAEIIIMDDPHFHPYVSLIEFEHFIDNGHRPGRYNVKIYLPVGYTF